MSSAATKTKYIVVCGSASVAPYPEFTTEAEAIARYEKELLVPSYFGSGHRRQASVVKITTITELVREGTAPAPLLLEP